MQSLNIWMLLGTIIMGIAWLLPNAAQPWLSAWSEGAAIVGVMFFGLAWLASGHKRSMVSKPLVLIAIASILSVLIQALVGRMLFYGDAIMTAIYLIAWLLAVHAGSVVKQLDSVKQGQHLDIFFAILLISALVSVGLALMQWLGVKSLGVYILDLPPNGRPFANLGQPNNFNTLCFLGSISLLYFYERKRLNGPLLLFGWSCMMLGMALSYSRTGWLQISCIVIFLTISHGRYNFRCNRRKIIYLTSIYVVFVVLLPSINEVLYLGSPRTLASQTQEIVRLPYWVSMLHAIFEQPWFGYGWLQTGLAQQASQSPAFHAGIFNFSHNIILDIFIWTGLPVGLIILSCLIWWVVYAWRSVENSLQIVMIIGILGVSIHAMLEYPLAYAYFLIPIGFMMGSLEMRAASTWIVTRWQVALLSAVLAVAALLVGMDYFAAEKTARDMRYQSARIGMQVEPVEVPKLLLLNQLDGLLRYGYQDPSEDISMEELAEFGYVSDRYGFTFVMFRYALASAFLGEYELTRKTLTNICRIHVIQKCRQAQQEWINWSEKYPNSVGKVDFP